MRTDTGTLRTIGVECESVEGDLYGVSRLVRQLLKQLASRPELATTHRFILYFKRHVPADLPPLDPKIFSTRVIGVPSFSLYYYVLLPIRLWWDRPDAMYYPNYMLPLIHPPFVPSLVMLTEDIWHQIHDPRLASRYRAAYAVFARWAAHRATRIMAISHASREGLQRLFRIAPERISVNALGVDAIKTVQPMLGTYVLFVGQAFERRHLRETIHAFRELAVQEPQLRLVAIGPDKYEPPIIDTLIRQTNEHLGRPAIQHIERVSDEDLARFYKGAQTLIYISAVEAFGLPPLEALGYGVPAVLADTSVNREIYSEHAFYVADPFHSEAIATAMRTARSDNAHREHIKTAAPAILARYTWPAHADRFLQIISDMTT